jgi:ribosomal RNA assembly protein
MQLIKIPSARIEAIIGKGGKTKKEIEKRGNVTLEIDAESNVQITSEDPVAEWRAVDIVKAIGRGFEPETAMKLFREEYAFKLIDLKIVFAKEKQRERYKARVIGTKGKAKKIIEELSGAQICVYGNTIGIIGKIDEVDIASEAVRMLLTGAPHGVAYFVLQKEKRRSSI